MLSLLCVLHVRFSYYLFILFTTSLLPYTICMIAYIFIGTKPYAPHGLVLMICGIFTRWIQVVAYYYTPEGFNGEILKDIILKIIEKKLN